MEEPAFMTESIKALKDQNTKELENRDRDRELETQMFESERLLKNKDIKDIQDQLKENDTELENLKQMFENERSLKNRDVKDIQDQLKEKDEELENLKEMFENERSLKNKDIKDIQDQLKELENLKEMFENDRSLKNKDVKGIQDQLKEKDKELENLKEMFENERSLKNKDIKDIQDQLKEKDKELENLKQMFENDRSLKNKDFKDIQDQLKEKDKELENLKEMFENERSLKNKDIKDIQDQLKELENLKQMFENDRSLKNKDVKDIQDQLKEKDKELENLKQMFENDRSQKNKEVKDIQDQQKEKDKELENLNQMFESERSLNRFEEQETEQLEKPRMTEPMQNLGGNKVFAVLAGKTNDSHTRFIGSLKTLIPNLTEVFKEDESDIVLVFCPVVSRRDIDIESALKRFTDSTASKLNILVVLHHTFDPEKTVPDSSRCVNRTDILTVDCLFNEDTGLLKCQRNDDAMDKVVNLFRQPDYSTGVNKYPPRNKSTVSTDRTQRMKLGSTSNNAQPISSSTVKYFVTLPGNRQKYHSDFLDALHRETPGLVMVSTVQESDVILHFHSESLAALKDYKRRDKPFVDIVLHNTLDSTSVPKSSGCLNNSDVFIVDCVICEAVEDLPECNKNREAIAAVSQWLSTKIKWSH